MKSPGPNEQALRPTRDDEAGRLEEALPPDPSPLSAVFSAAMNTVRIVSYDSPGNQQFLRDVLASKGLPAPVCVSTRNEFVHEVKKPADLLIITTHGQGGTTNVGCPSVEMVDIRKLQGQCNKLLVVACNQDKNLSAPLWAQQFNATEVIAASGIVPSRTCDRAVARVLERGSAWRNGDLILKAALGQGWAPALHGAGWYVYP